MPPDALAPPADAIVTRTETVWLGEDGILRVVVAPDREMALGDAEENVRVCWEVARCEARGTLIDMRALRASATREARAYYARPQPGHMPLAVALLVRSPVSRLVGNFFIGVHRTPFPLRLFEEIAPALAWLRSFVDRPSRTGRTW